MTDERKDFIFGLAVAFMAGSVIVGCAVLGPLFDGGAL